MQLDDAERQLIEILREQVGDRNLRLVIEHVGSGGWEIEMSATLKTIHGEDKPTVARGVGSTFGEAWINTVPARS